MPGLNAIGIVVSDMAARSASTGCSASTSPTLPDEGHIDTFLPNGVRFMLDGEDVIKSFREDWTREAGNQVALAFECASPAEVDGIYKRATEAGFEGEKEPWDAFWGQRYAQLKDPNGVPVDLYASLLV